MNRVPTVADLRSRFTRFLDIISAEDGTISFIADAGGCQQDGNFIFYSPVLFIVNVIKALLPCYEDVVGIVRINKLETTGHDLIVQFRKMNDLRTSGGEVNYPKAFVLYEPYP